LKLLTVFATDGLVRAVWGEAARESLQAKSPAKRFYWLERYARAARRRAFK
jgi:hypothetical protein